MSAFTIIVVLAATLLLNCLVLSYAVFALFKRMRALEQALSIMNAKMATTTDFLENVISFTLLAILSAQQGVNVLFSLISNKDEVVTMTETHNNEIKIH